MKNSKLDVKTVEESLAMEREKMDLIRKKRNEQEERRADVDLDFEERCKEPLKEIIDRILQEEVDGIATQNGHHTEEDSHERVERIRRYLRTGEFEAVSRLVIHLDKGNYEERKQMPHEAQVLYFTVLLHSYLLNNYVSRIFLEFYYIAMRKFI